MVLSSREVTKKTEEVYPVKRILWLAVVALTCALPASAAGPFRFYPLTPCRLVDTRQPADAPILSHGATRTFTIQGKCGVPSGAKAVALNVTVIGPTGQGYLTVFPAGTARPIVSNINYAGGESALANGVIVPLGASTPDLSVFPYVIQPYGVQGQTHLVLDVSGYFDTAL